MNGHLSGRDVLLRLLANRNDRKSRLKTTAGPMPLTSGVRRSIVDGLRQAQRLPLTSASSAPFRPLVVCGLESREAWSARMR